MLIRTALISGSSLLFVGCSTGTGEQPLSANHPASCCAPEAPVARPSGTLSEHSSTPAPAATESNEQAATSQPAVARAEYACPMHPEVTSDKPGNCPTCGMALAKKGLAR